MGSRAPSGDNLRNFVKNVFGMFGDAMEQSGVADLQIILPTDLLTVSKGGKVKMHFTRTDLCNTCKGSGAKPGTRPARVLGAKVMAFFYRDAASSPCR